jgi:hypothetical protein
MAWPLHRDEVGAPVIHGSVPDHYQGPLYYRWHVFTYHGYRQPLQLQIVIEDRSIAERLMTLNQCLAALRRDRRLCDENGELRADLRAPLKARLRTKAYKSWPEITAGMLILVSPRVRDVIESFDPGVHYFVPIDIADRTGGSFRTYAFFPGRTSVDPMLAPKANGLACTVTDGGDIEFRYPESITTTEQFGYLNRAVIGDAALLYDYRIGLMFSAPLVEQLGDALPKNQCFVPMGVVDEPLSKRLESRVSA